MSVVIETTLGDITIDLFVKERPRATLNFLKLCKIKYYNYNLFHTISHGFIAQTGDPTGTRNGGESIHGVIEGSLKRYFQGERTPRLKHTYPGLVSFVGNEDNMIGSQFFITLGTDLTYLDEQHCVFGEVVEGADVLELLNETICDQDNRPYQDVRITHTVVLDDPFPDPERLCVPEKSPSPSAERLQGGRIAPDEEIDETEGKTVEEINEIVADKLAKAGATILEMIGDIPDAEVKPPENVLFVCKLNPVTTDEDLNIIFSRFGKIISCEVIRDRKTGESLQYAFVEFDEQKSCEDAYFKMDNVLIDDRRIHVDFSQSVAKVKWHGKGRGVTIYDDNGRKGDDRKNDLGKGRYNRRNQESRSGYKEERYRHQDFRKPETKPRRSRSRSRSDNRRSSPHGKTSPARRFPTRRISPTRSSPIRRYSPIRSSSTRKSSPIRGLHQNTKGSVDSRKQRRSEEVEKKSKSERRYKEAEGESKDKKKRAHQERRRSSSTDDSEDPSSSSSSDEDSSTNSSDDERRKKKNKKSKRSKHKKSEGRKDNKKNKYKKKR